MDLYKRLWPYINRYLKWTILAILCTLVVSATNGLMAWLIKPVINDIFINKDRTFLKLLPLIVVAVSLIKGLFAYFQAYLMQNATWCAVRDIRNDLYSHITYFPMKEYNATSTGNLISRVINDVGLVSRLAASVIKDFLQQVFTILGLLIVLFINDWKLALISMVVFPFAGLFVSKYGIKMRAITRKAQAAQADILSVLQETFTGNRIVKTFTMEEGEKKRFAKENDSLTRLIIRTVKVSSRVSPTMDIAGGIGVGIIIFYGGERVINGVSTPGDFFSFIAALVMLYPPAKAMGNLHNSVQQGMAAVERVFEVMDTETEMPMMDKGVEGPDGIGDAIEYKDVCFTYDPEKGPVLKDVSIKINRGEIAAFVGSSGGGKTTLVNLLPRFYDLNTGSIHIDGRDIREFKLRTLRQQIAIVTQDTILFNDTIRNNIAYGMADAPFENVVAAAKAAHADGFIDRLPLKYDTMIGEKGVLISGGEKQRISIARAILKDSPILILDEATSSLDTESERMVQKALENLMKNRTTLVIAHRLSTVINADKIIVMSAGQVADIGRHAELLSRSPIYQKLYNMQFGQAIEEHVEAHT